MIKSIWKKCLLLTIVTVLAAQFCAMAAIPQAEHDALMALYNATAGASWTTNTGWGGALGTENTWYGVTTDAGNTMVLRIDLNSNNLVGTIPSDLQNLTNLQALYLCGNTLSGTIPVALGNLTNLGYLALESNQLAGSIPVELGNLTNLYELHLLGNQLSGSIPTQLGSMTNLLELGLGSNQLSGSIPTQLGNLTNLKELYLAGNQLTGSIPTQLGSLSNLTGLYLWGNKLSGTIPAQIGNLTNLTDLYIQGNMLSGAIPASLTNLTALGAGALDLRYNALSSTDATLIAFLNSKQAGGDWQSTQTIAPTGVTATLPTASTVTISWTPIAYTGDTGGYRVSWSKTSGGPYTLFDMTADKSTSSMVVTGLTSGTSYCFVVETRTNSHSNNQNTVTSGYSTQVCASTTTCSTITVTPASLPNGVVGAAYNQSMTATGGTASYTFTETTGNLPAGMGLSGVGILSGTPTTAGSYNITIKATDKNGCTGSTSYTFIVNAATCPTMNITPATLPNGQSGVSYTQTLSVTGGVAAYTWTKSSGTLPAGLTLSTTGVLSGTPTTAGTYNFAIMVTDKNGCMASKSYSIVISSCPTITLNPATLPGPIINAAYNQTITATGGATPYSFAVSSGTLPGGLSLSAAGVITGTPTTAGSSTFTITATDKNLCTGSKDYTVSVCPAITLSPASLPEGSIGVAYNQTISASGGTSPYTLALSGTLPAGITFNAATGALSGTPTASANASFTITATDKNLCTGTASYKIRVCSTITLSPASLTPGTAGTAYSQTILAAGGTAPYTYSSTGTLPAGLTLSSAGLLSGTPTVSGIYDFTVTATDYNTCTSSKNYVMEIACPVITLLPAALPAGTAGIAYSNTISASGGAAPYTYASNGTLPPGLALSSAGVLSGVPTLAGTFAFSITATDLGGCTGSHSYSLVIGCPSISLSPSTFPVGTEGTPYSHTIIASGGTSPYSFAKTSGTLPIGLTLSSAGVISGTPTSGGTFTFTVTATDASGCTGVLNCSITIITPPYISSVKKMTSPFRIKIGGLNFHPDVKVYIGYSETPWQAVTYKGSTLLVIKKGEALKAVFPKGVVVQIKIVNQDGGYAITAFKR